MEMLKTPFEEVVWKNNIYIVSGQYQITLKIPYP